MRVVVWGYANSWVSRLYVFGEVAWESEWFKTEAQAREAARERRARCAAM